MTQTSTLSDAVFACPPAATAFALGITVHSVTVAGTLARYIDEGAGPPVLLLHGAPVASLGFVRVVERLRGNHRVIAPDLPGFGSSRAAPDFGETLAEYASFVERFCLALGLSKLVIFVTDASGSFGLLAAARLGDRVRGVVVADTVQFPLRGLATPVRLVLRYVMGSRIARALNRRFNLLPWLVAHVAPWLHPLPRVVRRALVAQFDTPDKRDRVLTLLHQMGRDEDFMRVAADEVSRRLRKTPALLIYGQLDPMRFVGAPGYFRRLLPDSTLDIVPLEEHFPILASGAHVADSIHAWITTRGLQTPDDGESNA